jgi:hypothetical protein
MMTESSISRLSRENQQLVLDLQSMKEANRHWKEEAQQNDLRLEQEIEQAKTKIQETTQSSLKKALLQVKQDMQEEVNRVELRLLHQQEEHSKFKDHLKQQERAFELALKQTTDSLSKDIETLRSDFSHQLKQSNHGSAKQMEMLEERLFGEISNTSKLLKERVDQQGQQLSVQSERASKLEEALGESKKQLEDRISQTEKNLADLVEKNSLLLQKQVEKLTQDLSKLEENLWKDMSSQFLTKEKQEVKTPTKFLFHSFSLFLSF